MVSKRLVNSIALQKARGQVATSVYRLPYSEEILPSCNGYPVYGQVVTLDEQCCVLANIKTRPYGTDTWGSFTELGRGYDWQHDQANITFPIKELIPTFKVDFHGQTNKLDIQHIVKFTNTQAEKCRGQHYQFTVDLPKTQKRPSIDLLSLFYE